MRELVLIARLFICDLKVVACGESSDAKPTFESDNAPRG